MYYLCILMVFFLFLYSAMTGDDTDPDPYQCFIDSDIVGDNIGEWKIGVRQILSSELNMYTSKSSLPIQVPGKPNKSHC